MNRSCRLMMLAVALAMAGCTFTSRNVIAFNRSELAKVPSVAYPHLFKAAEPTDRMQEYVLVRVRGESGKLRVIRFLPPDRILVTNRKGQDKAVAMADVVALEHVREFRHASSAEEEAEGAAEFVMLSPLLPAALLVGPYFGSIDEAERKADLAYDGLTKAQLIQWLGPPLERHRCISSDGSTSELWIYPPSKVLSGGQIMHLDEHGKAYFFSMKNYWKNDPHCRRIPTPSSTQGGHDG